ncbi:amidohydrolase family protein [Rathayibacter soli]|uniref:amidohydrolase family protein n=1 Tax=Rathayibacter soli TaxID=3144168 RepID=UPI0027E516E6|nr:amidohydrolase family protein [Glaciibacter superstes]
MPLIDAHLHVWYPDCLRYDWLEASPELNRQFGFDELDAELGSRIMDLDGFVFVQADCAPDQALEEIALVSALAGVHPVSGIIVYAPLERPRDAAPILDVLSSNSRVVGVRRLLQSEPLGFARSPEVITGARELAARGLSFDACITYDQLPDLATLADAVPELRIVLDHLGKPDLTTTNHDAWRRDLAELARRPQVACKLSGLAPQTGSATWSDSEVIPFLEHALASFGAERCMFGSDWPASSTHTDYARWLDLVMGWTDTLSGVEAANILWRSAAVFYRLPDWTTAGKRG